MSKAVCVCKRERGARFDGGIPLLIGVKMYLTMPLLETYQQLSEVFFLIPT